MTASKSHRVAIYGWGVVAPGARDVRSFRDAILRGKSLLSVDPRGELGHRLFAVGDPDFDFERYREWVVSRAGEPRYNQLKSKMGDNALFAIGATIQSVESNPGLEAALRALDGETQVIIGSGVGDLPQSYAAHDTLARATRAWNRFWADPKRCAARRAFEEESRLPKGPPPPADPSKLEPDSEERFAARAAWDAYWANHSEQLARFEERFAEIERTPVGDDAEKGPLHAIKSRQRLHRKLLDEAGCPPPPWDSVDPRLVWAIQNIPAAQVSMILGTHGPAWAPVGACSTFGLALKSGRDAILRGEAKAAIIGTTDPRPDAALIAAFYRARLTPATGDVNLPLTTLLGTHIAGGACIWVIADVDEMEKRGVRPVGPTLEGVALSSDAEHIITPSVEGPKRAIRIALDEAGATPETLGAWDLHATGTPGDVAELKLSQGFVGAGTAISARKGMFGHGMANAGGWELTALAMGLNERQCLPTGVTPEVMHPALRDAWGPAVVTELRPLQGRHGVKLMLGVGGITACVVLGCEAGNAAG